MGHSSDAHAAAAGVRVGAYGRRWGGPLFNETMPFFWHRTVAEVWEHEDRLAILRTLGR